MVHIELLSACNDSSEAHEEQKAYWISNTFKINYCNKAGYCIIQEYIVRHAKLLRRDFRVFINEKKKREKEREREREKEKKREKKACAPKMINIFLKLINNFTGKFLKVSLL